MEQTPVVFGSHVVNVRLTMGITTVNDKDTDLGMTLRRADSTLYEAKRQGRNRLMST